MASDTFERWDYLRGEAASGPRSELLLRDCFLFSNAAGSVRSAGVGMGNVFISCNHNSDDKEAA
jgi:hypothetical protein